MKKTHTDSGLTDIAGLMAERQQYESWLAALDARRDATPAHVFQRVHADYEGRLQRVLEQLSSHRAELEDRMATLTRRVASLQADEQVRRDERAELELRAHVGELSAEAFEKAAADCEREIAEAVAERTRVHDEAERTRAFLDAATRTPTPAQAQAASAQPVAEPAAEPVAEPVAAMPEAPAAPVETVPASAEQVTAITASTPAVAMPAAREEPIKAAKTRSGGFDELAFLSAVVGDAESLPPQRISQERPAMPAPPPEAPAEELPEAPAPGPRRSSKPDWISDEPFQPLTSTGDSDIIHEETESPLAGNVTGNHPIVLRPSGPTEHSKTLKCSECGAMNYATEWYCERCGAELAAL